jgi:hypothetical protein
MLSSPHSVRPSNAVADLPFPYCASAHCHSTGVWRLDDVRGQHLVAQPLGQLLAKHSRFFD